MPFVEDLSRLVDRDAMVRNIHMHLEAGADGVEGEGIDLRSHESRVRSHAA